ncbi:MAG: tetratricopeptide repeat protein [Lachnospiraceae bacterium]|nr:tetratricopeptide repeat protein [Lachnospiraceae bacterium]
MGQNTGKFFIAALIFCYIVFSTTGCGEAEEEYNKAVELMESGKYEDCLKHFSEAVKKNSEKAEYYIAYGTALNRTGRYKEAASEFGKAYQDTDNQISRQNNKRLYLGQAVAYYGMGESQKALEACDKALSYGKNNDVDIKIQSIKASVKLLMGDIAGAEEIYNNIIKEDGSQDGIYLARGRLYQMQGEEDKALKDYSSAIKVSEKCYDAYFAMYEIYTHLGDNSNAEDILKKLEGMEAETAEEILQLGRVYYYKGDYKNAKSSFDKSVKGGCNEALYYTGMVYMAEKDYNTAISKFKEYTGTGSTEKAPEAYNQLAGCYIELEDFESASAYIDKGMAFGVTDAGMVLGRNRVVLYERTGKYKKAKKAANSYLEKYPGDHKMEKELEFIKTRIKTMQLAKNDTRGEQQ